MSEMASLWPKGIESRRARAPVAILREQGALLGKITKNLVQGEVRQESSGDQQFRYSFFIVSPPLSYQYRLFSIYHDISMYPVEIYAEEQILQQADDGTLTIHQAQYDEPYLEAPTEESFVSLLRNIFGTQKTVAVITSLLSQADPQWDAKGDLLSPEEAVSGFEEETLPF